ncbi:unnamed protein product, partial [Lymnaea stagnalis]
LGSLQPLNPSKKAGFGKLLVRGLLAAGATTRGEGAVGTATDMDLIWRVGESVSPWGME